jgi:UMF1 family MFS transporter
MILDRLGLGRRDLRAWAIYDLAQAAFQATIVAAIFPIYFQKVAAAGTPAALATSRFAWATTWSILIVAVITPFLGAIADYAAIKKSCSRSSSRSACVATALMYPSRAATGTSRSHLRNRQRRRGLQLRVLRIASAAPCRPGSARHCLGRRYGIGYVGGGVMLAIDMLLMAKPSGLAWRIAGWRCALRLLASRSGGCCFQFRSSVTSGAAPAARADETAGQNAFVTATRRLVGTFHELRLYRQAFMLLLAFLLYNDGIQTIIRMATTYGTEIGIDETAMLGALLVTQFIGVPFAFIFGKFAGRVGAKTAVFVGLAVYAVITLLAYFMHNAWQFFALAMMVGMVQGGTQALSRSLFASMIPRHRSSEFFAFFGVFERYAGILGPAIFAWMASHSGTSRNAILSVLAFFVIGAALLTLDNVYEGRRAANEPAAARR